MTHKRPGWICYTSKVVGARHSCIPIWNQNTAMRDIAWNKYRLIVAFAYRMQIAYIKFVGTHAEYDKVDAASVDQS